MRHFCVLSIVTAVLTAVSCESALEHGHARNSWIGVQDSLCESCENGVNKKDEKGFEVLKNEPSANHVANDDLHDALLERSSSYADSFIANGDVNYPRQNSQQSPYSFVEEEDNEGGKQSQEKTEGSTTMPDSPHEETTAHEDKPQPPDQTTKPEAEVKAIKPHLHSEATEPPSSTKAEASHRVEDSGEDPIAKASSMGNEELLKILGIIRPKPKVSKRALEVFNELGDRGTPALDFVIRHPEGPEYHEVKFNEEKPESYIETHIVKVPGHFGDMKEGVCRFVLNIDSPIFYMSPLFAVVTTSLLQLIISILSVDAKQAGVVFKLTRMPYLSANSILAEGSCKESMALLQSFTRLVGDYSAFSFFGDQFTREEAKAIMKNFFLVVGQEVQAAKEASTKNIEHIFDELRFSLSRSPYLASSAVAAVDESVPDSNPEEFLELGREALHESLNNAHVSLVAVGAFDAPSGINRDEVLTWTRNLGSDLDFTKIRSIEYLNTYRKVEWPPPPHRVIVEKNINNRGQEIRSIAGVSYQIFEDDLLGIKHHSCQTLLMLDAIARIGQYIGSRLISGTLDVPLGNTALRDALKSVGVQSLHLALVDPHDDAPYFHIKALSTKSIASAVAPILQRFITYLGNVLTKSTSEELSKLISYAEWEPELLLFKQSGKTSFDLLADFYTNQVGDRMYDFSRPSECLELYGSISDKKPIMVELWNKFFSESLTTHYITVLLDNSVTDVATAVAALKADEHADLKEGHVMEASTTIIKTPADVLRFIRSRPLLPASCALPSIALHEIFLRGWEGEKRDNANKVTPSNNEVKPTTKETPTAAIDAVWTPSSSSLSFLSPLLTMSYLLYLSVQ